MTAHDILVWIDCEMTGLIPHKDCLIEVAVVPTDAQLNVLDSGFSIVIRPPDKAMDHMGDFVRAMHTRSGLLEELDNGCSVEQAEQQVLDYIKRFIPQPNKALLAGNSVGTDKLFLDIEMPRVVDHLHYRLIDVSSVKELAKRWIPRAYFKAPDKATDHRALADIKESIRELRYYRAVLFPQGEGPSSDKCLEVAEQVAHFSVEPHDGWQHYVHEHFVDNATHGCTQETYINSTDKTEAGESS